MKKKNLYPSIMAKQLQRQVYGLLVVSKGIKKDINVVYVTLS
jgi:hypothetical protein